MPRTRRSVPPYSLIPSPPESAANSASCCFRESTVPHALFAPLHYERGYAYPLIVWLHGRDGNERQLLRIMPLVSMRNYVAVAPRGNRLPDQSGRESYGWLQTDEHIQQAEQSIFDSVEIASRKFHVCSRRIFLTGFDQGGTMALRTALGHPDSIRRGHLVVRELSDRRHALRQPRGGATAGRSSLAPVEPAKSIRPLGSARTCACFTRRACP